MDTTYLQHYGIPRRSGRYPFGSGNRPFQGMKSEKDRRKYAESKESVLKKGSATQVMAYKSELTDKELQSVVQRLNMESRLSELSKKEANKNTDKIDDLMKKIKKMDDWAKIGTNVYNTIALLYNLTETGRKHPLSKIH